MMDTIRQAKPAKLEYLDEDIFYLLPNPNLEQIKQALMDYERGKEDDRVKKIMKFRNYYLFSELLPHLRASKYFFKQLGTSGTAKMIADVRIVHPEFHPVFFEQLLESFGKAHALDEENPHSMLFGSAGHKISNLQSWPKIDINFKKIEDKLEETKRSLKYKNKDKEVEEQRLIFGKECEDTMRRIESEIEKLDAREENIGGFS